MYRQFKPIIRWVGSALAVTALTTSAALAQNTGKLKVGFMLPYTGTFAALGIAIENGNLSLAERCAQRWAKIFPNHF